MPAKKAIGHRHQKQKPLPSKAPPARRAGRASLPVPGQAQERARQREGQDEARKAAVAIVEGGLEKKALRVEVMDVRGKVDYADYVVVMSGRSDRQVNAIARGIEEHMKQKLGVRCLSVEGMAKATWVLMDFGDVIVHIFHEEARAYYDLESLWMDAARVNVGQPATA